MAEKGLDRERRAAIRSARHMRVDLSLVVPCFNEYDNLDVLVARVAAMLRDLPARAELVLVDDGSRDESWAAMEHMARRHDFVVAVRHASNRGIVAAWRSGVGRARGDLICIFDADLQYRPEDIPRLLAIYRSAGVDMVQGARIWTGHRWGAPRFWISRGLNALLNRAFGMSLDDNKSGFLLCRRELFETLLGHRERYHAWQNLVMVAAHARGYTVRSVPVAFEPRTAGHSFLPAIPVRHSLRSLADLWRALGEYKGEP
jgi:phenylacetate-CoA ligase